MTKIYSILTIILFTSASYAQSFGIEESLSLKKVWGQRPDSRTTLVK
jgi:hypothetical protein